MGWERTKKAVGTGALSGITEMSILTMAWTTYIVIVRTRYQVYITVRTYHG